jgi:hypothetical protein
MLKKPTLKKSSGRRPASKLRVSTPGAFSFKGLRYLPVGTIDETRDAMHKISAGKEVTVETVRVGKPDSKGTVTFMPMGDSVKLVTFTINGHRIETLKPIKTVFKTLSVRHIAELEKGIGKHSSTGKSTLKSIRAAYPLGTKAAKTGA